MVRSMGWSIPTSARRFSATTAAMSGLPGCLRVDRLDLTEDTDWDEISELLDATYRRTAGPRRVAVLDARAPGR
jgi:hypothetical protein